MPSVAVLGGGPAAATAGLALARGGAAVDLFQPERRGEKPCGGALPEQLLGELPGFAAEGLPVVESPAALLENASGGTVSVRLDGLRIFRRGDLDPALLAAAAAAGVRWLRSRVEELEPSPDGVTVTAAGERRRYRWVVAGDGARGLSRRALGLGPVGDSFGLGASLAGAEAGSAGDRMVLSFPDAGDAYLWIFPRPGGVSVGIAYTPGRLSHGAARGLLDGFLARHLGVPESAAQPPAPRHRYPIPVWSPAAGRAVAAAAARRVLLVGDAAAVADPLTREGIRPAVRSGLLAAECLLAGRAEEYPERLRTSLEGEMGRARAARRLFFEEPLGQWMVPVSRYHPGVRRVLAELLSCRRGYTGLRRGLLWAVVVGASSPP